MSPPPVPVPDSAPDSALGEEPRVRPVGTWVVAGFLLSVSLLMWGLVAVIFHARS